VPGGNSGKKGKNTLLTKRPEREASGAFSSGKQLPEVLAVLAKQGGNVTPSRQPGVPSKHLKQDIAGRDGSTEQNIQQECSRGRVAGEDVWDGKLAECVEAFQGKEGLVTKKKERL